MGAIATLVLCLIRNEANPTSSSHKAHFFHEDLVVAILPLQQIAEEHFSVSGERNVH